MTYTKIDIKENILQPAAPSSASADLLGLDSSTSAPSGGGSMGGGGLGGLLVDVFDTAAPPAENGVDASGLTVGADDSYKK